LEAVSESHTQDEFWQQLKDITLNAAKATVQKDGKKGKSWISSDTFQLIERKHTAKAQSSTKYKRLRSEVQKMLRRDKRAELCDELEDNAKKGKSRLVSRQ